MFVGHPAFWMLIGVVQNECLVLFLVFRLCMSSSGVMVIEEEVGQGAKESSKAASTDSGRFLVWHRIGVLYLNFEKFRLRAFIFWKCLTSPHIYIYIINYDHDEKTGHLILYIFCIRLIELICHIPFFDSTHNSVLRKPTDFDRSFDWTTTTHLHLVISTSRDPTTMMCPGFDVSHIRSKLKFLIGISSGQTKWNSKWILGPKMVFDG